MSEINNPKITVIVPAFNSAKYISQCLDSVINQTLKELEIIIVYDESKDNTLEIIQQYEKKDQRIKTIIRNRKDAGYGSACNEAIEIAQGEYIAIIETDDFIKLDKYERLYLQAKELNVDLIKSPFWMYFDDENGDEWMNKIRWAKDINPPSKVFKITDYPVFFYHHPCIWSAIYKKSFLDEKNIRFNEIKGAGWVDNPFNMKALVLADKIAWDGQAYYYYRQTNAEASSFLKDYRVPVDRVTEMFDFIESRPDDYKKIAEYFFLRILAYVDICIKTALANEKDFQAAMDNVLGMINRIPKDYISDNPIEFKPFEGRLKEFKNTSCENYLNGRITEIQEKEA